MLEGFGHNANLLDPALVASEVRSFSADGPWRLAIDENIPERELDRQRADD